VSDGTLAVHQRAGNAGQEAEGELSFYAILDRTGQRDVNDTLVLNVPIRVFITGGLAFHATVVGKEGMDKAHCHWCKLRSAEWQACAHERGIGWDSEEMKRAHGALSDTNETQNGVKSSMLIDCIELERCIFPVLHVTLGPPNRLLKDMIDCSDLVAEDTAEELKEASHKQTEAEHNHVTIKQEITDRGKQNGPTPANMHMAQGHLDEQIQVQGELSQQEIEQAILDSASLKEEIKTFKKELSVLKNQKQDLSRRNSAATAEVGQVEKDLGRCNKPVRRGIKSILSKDWNIKRPSWHGGDILGNKCPKLLSSAKLILEQIMICTSKERSQEAVRHLF
jgi:hypothetical protein